MCVTLRTSVTLSVTLGVTGGGGVWCGEWMEGMMKPPAHTCPWIDQVQTLVRRHIRGPDRRVALTLLENLRGANLQLRVVMVDALTPVECPVCGSIGGEGSVPSPVD